MLPWGTDQTWETRLAFGGRAGIMLNRCLEDESCAAAYAEALRRVRDEVAAPRAARPRRRPRRPSAALAGDRPAARALARRDPGRRRTNPGVHGPPRRGPQRLARGDAVSCRRAAAAAAGHGRAAAVRRGPAPPPRGSRYSPRARTRPPPAPASASLPPASSSSAARRGSAPLRGRSASAACRRPGRGSSSFAAGSPASPCSTCAALRCGSACGPALRRRRALPPARVDTSGEIDCLPRSPLISDRR